MLKFQGVHQQILDDTSPERDVEGSLNCGKTTVCLWDELDAIEQYPGIWTLLARYSDDSVSTKLRPAFDQLCAIRGLAPHWDDKKKFYQFENGSRAYAFGLKAVSLVERYEKIRGLPVSRIFVDQAEAVPSDIAGELRARLRPDVIAKERGIVYPTQLTFSANPVADDHWLATQFPIKNNLPRRKYFCVSLEDNSHNLPADTVAGIMQAFPPDHPKHTTVVLGQRGLNVIGEPIYDQGFRREIHVKPTPYLDGVPLLEGFFLGKHNPVWVAAQQTYAGGLRLLGGIIGSHQMLEDFLPLVLRYRQEWFPNAEVRSCTAPMGERHSNDAMRVTLLSHLRAAKIHVQWQDTANAPDVVLAMIEHLGGCLRRRTLGNEEALIVNSDQTHWLQASREEAIPKPFVEYGFAGGYTWSEHFVSVANKEIRQPHEDDWFANGQHCVENIVLNFIVGQPSQSERDARAAAQREQSGGPSAPSGPNAWMAC